MTAPLPSSPIALATLAPTRQFQTAHGRAQLKVFAVGWSVLLGVASAVFVVADVGAATWGLVGTVALTVGPCLLITALRRNAYGLYVSPDEVATWGLLLKTTVDNGSEVNVRWVDQGKSQYLQLRKRYLVRRRVTYLSHITQKSTLRRFYPAENHLLERVPGSGWQPTGAVWTDEGGADPILDWLGIARDTSEYVSHEKLEPKNPVRPEDAPSLREIMPVLLALIVAVVVMCVVIVVFESNWVLQSVVAALVGLVGIWGYKRIERIADAKKTAREAREAQVSDEAPGPARPLGQT